MNENIIIQAEAILSTTRAECLRGMDTGNMDARLAWYYTHCGEMEMASYLGAITNERMNALESEWKEHKPVADSAPRQPDRLKGEIKMKFVFGYYTGNGGGRNTIEADNRKEAEKRMREYIETIRPGYRYDLWLEVQLTENVNRR